MKKIVLLNLSLVLGINSFIKPMDATNNAGANSIQKIENTTLSPVSARDHLALQVIPVIELQNLIADYLKQWVEVNSISGHTSTTSFAPNNKHLASFSHGESIEIRDVMDSFKLLHTLAGHTGTVTSVAFAPNSKYLASSGKDNTIKIWHYEGIEKYD